MSSVPERIYPLVKIAAGDYLLLADDRRTLWRIRRYDEGFIGADGLTVEQKPCWGIWHWYMTPRPDNVGLVDPDDWGQWEFWDGPFGRRAEAVRDTLRARR